MSSQQLLTYLILFLVFSIAYFFRSTRNMFENELVEPIETIIYPLALAALFAVLYEFMFFVKGTDPELEGLFLVLYVPLVITLLIDQRRFRKNILK